MAEKEWEKQVGDSRNPISNSYNIETLGEYQICVSMKQIRLLWHKESKRSTNTETMICTSQAGITLGFRQHMQPSNGNSRIYSEWQNQGQRKPFCCYERPDSVRKGASLTDFHELDLLGTSNTLRRGQKTSREENHQMSIYVNELIWGPFAE